MTEESPEPNGSHSVGSHERHTGAFTSDERTFGASAVDRIRALLTRGRQVVARILLYSMTTATLAALPLMWVVPGSRIPKIIGTVSVLTLIAVYFGVLRLVRQRALMPDRRFVGPLAITVGTIAGVALNYSLGLFTPLPFAGLLGLVIIYLGVGSSEYEARLLFITSAVLYGVAIALCILDVLPQIGLVDSGPVSRRTMWVGLAGNQAALFFSYGLAWTTGSFGQQLLQRLDTAVREATRREALLHEVRADLERAAGVGSAGLFTELELGAYRLEEVIGRGGMGEVYAASDRRDGSAAAIKLLRRDVMSDPDAVSRFEREARIAAKLQSDHVVRVFEVGGLEAPLPFIAMERLVGEDLGACLRTRGRLPLDEVAVLVDHVCEGLAEAHARGIVHRDLKPQNLFLHRTDAGRRWKILDFGVSKLVFGADASLAADHVVGTPAYMAPEQALGSSEVDLRADLYALSVVVYRALTGAPAFASGPAAVVLRSVTETMPLDPSRLATLNPDIVRVLRIGLDKSPPARFASAEEFATAFRRAARGELTADIRDRADQLLAHRGWAIERAEPRMELRPSSASTATAGADEAETARPRLARGAHTDEVTAPTLPPA